MKLRLAKAQLRAALDTVAACVARTSTLPILDYLLIEPIQGALRISGSNLETTLAVDVPMDGIKPSPAWTAPAHKIKAIAAAAPGQEIACSVGESSITLTSGQSRWRLPTLPAEQWPDRQDPGGMQEIAIAAETLRRMITATLPATAKNDARYYLKGIHLETATGTLTACGTDGHRLHAAEAVGDYPDGIDLIIPRQSAQIIETALPTEGEVILAYSPGRVRVSHPGCILDAKLIDGRYPDWRRTIPRAEMACRTDGPGLIRAIDRTALLENQYRALRLDFQPDHIKISASSSDGGESSDRVDANYDGEPVVIGVNSLYMADALAAIGGVVRIGIADSQKSLLIEPSEHRGGGGVNIFAVVSPLRI
jgi:DNA polymerase-3 subunit beta